LTWQRLSVRAGNAHDDVPYEGVPTHLFEPLRHWVDTNFGGNPGSDADVNGGPRLILATRAPVTLARGQNLTVHNVTRALSSSPANMQFMLDAVDAVLHFKGYISKDALQYLDGLLKLGGSAWQVDPNGGGLVRRLDAPTVATYAEASSPSDTASRELKEAWTSAYGRNPNASDAWDHSIKAVEAILIPIVVPAKGKATLSDVVGMLDNQGSRWKLSLHGHDDSQSVAPLVSMLRLMWPNPDRHGGENSRTPSLVEAQAVVHLAVALVQWARAGMISKQS
jgi:hypothetical protein